VTRRAAGAPPVIALWSPPRSLSTAFTRMMMERPDVHVVHEPISNLLSVGEFDVHGVTVRSSAELFDRLFELAEDRPVFFKDTTEYRYLPYFDDRVVHDVTHTFIVREPAATIASHHAVNPELTLEQVGYEWSFELFEKVRAVTGAVPAVIDAADLLAAPATVVRAYCAAVGLPYLDETLTWSPGARTEWRRTEHWHHDVNASGAFRPSTNTYARTVENDDRLARFRAHHQPFYDRMTDLRIGSATRSGIS
jgi:hypothetical protein